VCTNFVRAQPRLFTLCVSPVLRFPQPSHRPAAHGINSRHPPHREPTRLRPTLELQAHGKLLTCECELTAGSRKQILARGPPQTCTNVQQFRSGVRPAGAPSLRLSLSVRRFLYRRSTMPGCRSLCVGGGTHCQSLSRRNGPAVGMFEVSVFFLLRADVPGIFHFL